jgi:hypothetical protein
VLCQARGASAAAVLAELALAGRARPGAAIRQLYAGCGAAALCSAAIGAVYLLAFYSAKRLGTRLCSATRSSGSSSGSSSSSSSTSGSIEGGGEAGAVLGAEATAAAGVLASLAGSIFEAPMEMFKLRTQVRPQQQQQNPSSIQQTGVTSPLA